MAVTIAAGGIVDRREPARADGGKQARAVGRSLGRGHGRDLRAQHIGQDLAPQRAGNSAARCPDLRRRRDPGRDHQIEAVAEAECNALENGARHVPPVVVHRQPDEGAAGEWIGVRASLAGEVRQKQQPVAAGRDRGGGGNEIAERDVRRQRIAEPPQAAGRRQHHRHHVPATRDRVAERVDAAVRVEGRRFCGREHDARRPEGQRDDSLGGRPDADSVRRLVAASSDDGGSHTEARGLRRSIGHGAGDLGPLECGRQPGVIDLEGGKEIVRPVARGEIEKDRARPIGLVHRESAREPESNVVLGQQDVGDLPPRLRLVVADPDDLRGGEPGERVVAGDPDQPLAPHHTADQVAFGGRPLVVPEDRRPEHLPGRVEQHQAVHLARQADCLHVRARCPGRHERLPDRRAGGIPPQGGVLLAPEWPRPRDTVLGDADRSDRPRRVDQDSLGRRRRNVEPQDEGHGPQRPAPDATRSPSTAQIDWLTRFSRSSWLPDTGCGSTSPEATLRSSDSSDSPPPRIAWPSEPLQPA